MHVLTLLGTAWGCAPVGLEACLDHSGHVRLVGVGSFGLQQSAYQRVLARDEPLIFEVPAERFDRWVHSVHGESPEGEVPVSFRHEVGISYVWIEAPGVTEVQVWWRERGSTTGLGVLLAAPMGDTTPPVWAGEHRWGEQACGGTQLELLSGEVANLRFHVQHEGSDWSTVVGPGFALDGDQWVNPTAPTLTIEPASECLMPQPSWGFEVSAIDAAGNRGPAFRIPALEPEMAEVFTTRSPVARGCSAVASISSFWRLSALVSRR